MQKTRDLFFSILNKPSKNNILNNLKNGDHLAFRQIFSMYYQPLFIFAQKFVDEGLANDFVQDCFYDLWKHREKVEIKSSLSAYLFTIIKNRCYKHYQREKRKITSSDNLKFQLHQQELNYFLHSEKSILEFDIKDRIQLTMNNLPEQCRKVFSESRMSGLSNKEIADKLKISVKTVEKHISKALRMFHHEFKDIMYILWLLLFQKFF